MITFARNKNCYKDPGFLKGLKSNWLLGDHLGSASMTANADGTFHSEVRYSAFGEMRYQNGTMTTDFLYTGQRQEVEIGLYYYVARWYDPAIGRFIQADSVVPNTGNAKGLDRFAYVGNNPLRYTDPSGNILEGACGYSHCADDDLTMDDALAEYNIIANGVGDNEKADLFFAAHITGSKISSKKDDLDPKEAFVFAHGPINITITGDTLTDPFTGETYGGNCLTIEGSITCTTTPDIPNTIHEFGHVFDNKYKREVGGNNTGTNNFIPLGDRTSVGYACGSPTGSCIMHSWVTYPDTGNSTIEEWGDMYLNWVLDNNPRYPNIGFTDDVPDTYSPYTRGQWMDYWMQVFLNEMGP